VINVRRVVNVSRVVDAKKQQTGGNLGFVDNISNIGSNFFESVVNVVNTAVYANPPVVPSSPLLGHFSKL